jgi:hypothetical protein
VAEYGCVEREFRVHDDPVGGVYVDARGYGCSRTYSGLTDRNAINRFLAEHACRATWINDR